MKCDPTAVNRVTLTSNGIYHPLETIFAHTNKLYFANSIDASIAYGNKITQSSSKKHSIRLGAYDPSERHITIHRALDQAFVPRICVERIVYHEMLHQKHPVKLSYGRRIIHSKDFKRDEALFENAQLADKLIEQILHRLLSYRSIF